MSIKKIVLILYGIIFCSNFAAAEQKSWYKFKPHEAIYHLSIGKVSNSSKVHNIMGEMHLTTKFACDGWVVNQNTTVDMTDKNGSQMRNIFRYSIWESKNHDALRFMSKTIVNSIEVSSYEGEAYIKGGIGKIIYISPHNKVINIPSNTLFPMKHFLLSLYDIGDENFANYTVFTGEDYDSLNNVSSFSKSTLIKGNLYKVIRSASYNYFKNTIRPENEIEIIVDSETGVVKKVIFDYLEYQVIGDLKAIKYYEKSKC